MPGFVRQFKCQGRGIGFRAPKVGNLSGLFAFDRLGRRSLFGRLLLG